MYFFFFLKAFFKMALSVLVLPEMEEKDRGSGNKREKKEKKQGHLS